MNSGIVTADRIVVPITICVAYSGLFFISIAMRDILMAVGTLQVMIIVCAAIGCIGPQNLMNSIVIAAAMIGLITSRNVVASITSSLKKFNGVLLICTPKAIIATPTKALAKILRAQRRRDRVNQKAATGRVEPLGWHKPLACGTQLLAHLVG